MSLLKRGNHSYLEKNTQLSEKTKQFIESLENIYHVHTTGPLWLPNFSFGNDSPHSIFSRSTFIIIYQPFMKFDQ